MRTAPVRSFMGGIHLGRGLSFFLGGRELNFYDVGGSFSTFNTLLYLTYLIFCDFRQSIVQPSYDNGL